MKINVKKYKFDNLYNKLYDSDWLEAELIMIISSRKIKINLEFLIVEELERIYFWLIDKLNNRGTGTKLKFIDPNLKFKIMTRSNMPVLKVIYYLNDSIESWELLINPANISSLASCIKTIIINYPCRCGKTHNIN